MKLFTASFYETNQALIPELDFNEFEELEEFAESIEDEEFDVDDIKIESNSASVVEQDTKAEFLSQFDELTYEIMTDVDNQEYDKYFDDIATPYYQYQYLVQDRGMSAEDAIENLNQVNVFNGDIEEYAEQYFYDVEIPKCIESYIDYERLGNDLVRCGDVVEFVDVLIVNANQF